MNKAYNEKMAYNTQNDMLRSYPYFPVRDTARNYLYKDVYSDPDRKQGNDNCKKHEYSRHISTPPPEFFP